MLTYAKHIETNRGRPSLNHCFYDLLDTIPGLDEDDFDYLMSTSGHRILFPETNGVVISLNKYLRIKEDEKEASST